MNNKLRRHVEYYMQFSIEELIDKLRFYDQINSEMTKQFMELKAQEMRPAEKFDLACEAYLNGGSLTELRKDGLSGPEAHWIVLKATKLRRFRCRQTGCAIAYCKLI